MDLEALRSRARRLSGVMMPELWADADVDAVINEAYLHICSLADWTFLYVHDDVPAETASLAIPADFRVVADVLMIAPERRQLFWRRLRELDAYPGWRNDGDLPELWAIEDDRTLLLLPPGDTGVTVRLRGRSIVDELAAAVDEPMFGSEFHPVVALDAAQRILVEEGDDSGRSDRYREEAVSYLLRMGSVYLPSSPQEAAASYMAAAAPPETGDIESLEGES